MNTLGRGALAVAGTLLVVAAVGAAVLSGGTAAGDDVTPADDEPAFVVEVHENGSAAVAVTYTFDLADEQRAAAFDDLQNDAAARETFRERFETRLGAVADNASAATGREMNVSGTTLALQTTNGTGVATVTATWTALAAVDGDTLAVTEPFASGFEPDRTLVLSAPEDYELSSVTPEPDHQNDHALAWDAGSDVTGFAVTATAPDSGGDSADDTTDDTDGVGETDGANDTADETDGANDTADESGTDGSGPGFGVVSVLAGLGLTGYLLRGRAAGA